MRTGIFHLRPQWHQFCSGQSLQIANVCLSVSDPYFAFKLESFPSIFYESSSKTYFSIFFWHFQHVLFLRSLFWLSLSIQSSHLQCLPIFFFLFFFFKSSSCQPITKFLRSCIWHRNFFYYNLKLSYLSHLFYMTVMRVLKWDSIFAVFQKCLLCCILFSNTLCIVPLISKGQMLIVGFSALSFH